MFSMSGYQGRNIDFKIYKNVSDILIVFILVAGTTFIIRFANALDMSILNYLFPFRVFQWLLICPKICPMRQ